MASYRSSRSQAFPARTGFPSRFVTSSLSSKLIVNLEPIGTFRRNRQQNLSGKVEVASEPEFLAPFHAPGWLQSASLSASRTRLIPRGMPVHGGMLVHGGMPAEIELASMLIRLPVSRRSESAADDESENCSDQDANWDRDCQGDSNRQCMAGADRRAGIRRPVLGKRRD